MKNVLDYYYDINILDYRIKDDKLLFYNKDGIYLLKEILDKENEIYPYALQKYTNNMSIIILNNNKEVVTNNLDKSYVLQKYNIIRDNIDVYINKNRLFLDYEKKSLDKWLSTIDYLYYKDQKNSLHIKEKIIANYFIGNLETAISIYNTINLDNIKGDVMHKRLTIPINCIEYYDLTNMIIDYSLRDISEYVKQLIYNDTFNIDNLIFHFNNNNYNSDEIKMFWAHLHYPSIYVDMVKKNKLDNTNLYKYMRRLEDYFKQIYMNIIIQHL